MLWQSSSELTISAIPPGKSSSGCLRKTSTMFVALIAREVRFTSSAKWIGNLGEIFLGCPLSDFLGGMALTVSLNEGCQSIEIA